LHMNITIGLLIGIGLVACIVGILIGKLIFSKNTRIRIQQAEEQAQKILSEAQLAAETLKEKSCWKPKKSICS